MDAEIYSSRAAVYLAPDEIETLEPSDKSTASAKKFKPRSTGAGGLPLPKSVRRWVGGAENARFRVTTAGSPPDRAYVDEGVHWERETYSVQ